MTHVIVSRVSFAVCLLALMCATLFAVLAAPASTPVAVARTPAVDGEAPLVTPATGAVLFDRHCARCHELARLAAAVRGAGGDSDAADARVRAFLVEHGAASDVEDAQIVAYLRANAN